MNFHLSPTQVAFADSVDKFDKFTELIDPRIGTSHSKWLPQRIMGDEDVAIQALAEYWN